MSDTPSKSEMCDFLTDLKAMSDMSDTPRTDALKFDVLKGYHGIREVVLAEDYAALEREAAALLEEQRKGTQIIARLHAEVAELQAMLREAGLQIEYMQEKFQPTSTGVAVLSRIEAALKGKP